MREAYDLAAKRSQWSEIQNKSNYDKIARSTVLQPGDRVLVHNLSERGGPGKLKSFWEKEIHRVVKQISGDIPVYHAVSERDSSQNVRNLHRNHFFPCDELPLDNDPMKNPAKKNTYQPKCDIRNCRI